jgi:hypothetical protein
MPFSLLPLSWADNNSMKRVVIPHHLKFQNLIRDPDKPTFLISVTFSKFLIGWIMTVLKHQVDMFGTQAKLLQLCLPKHNKRICN